MTHEKRVVSQKKDKMKNFLRSAIKSSLENQPEEMKKREEIDEISKKDYERSTWWMSDE